MKPVDSFYNKLDEPAKSVLLAMREIILAQDPAVTHELKYGMPFFCYQGKMFCYLWTHKKNGLPYLGLVEGKHFDEKYLLQETRSRMKIMLLDPEKDLPAAKIKKIVKKALDLYRSGKIKTKPKRR